MNRITTCGILSTILTLTNIGHILVSNHAYHKFEIFNEQHNILVNEYEKLLDENVKLKKINTQFE